MYAAVVRRNHSCSTQSLNKTKACGRQSDGQSVSYGKRSEHFVKRDAALYAKFGNFMLLSFDLASRARPKKLADGETWIRSLSSCSHNGTSNVCNDMIKIDG